MKFKVTEYISKFMKVGDEYTTVEVPKEYSVANWDDLQNLIMTLIDFTSDKITLKVEKEVIE